MSDEKSINQDVKTDPSIQADVKPTGSDQKEVVKAESQAIPYARFKEVNEELKEMKSKLLEEMITKNGRTNTKRNYQVI